MFDPVTLGDIYVLFQRSQEDAEQRLAEADKRLARADAIAALANQAVNSLSSLEDSLLKTSSHSGW